MYSSPIKIRWWEQSQGKHAGWQTLYCYMYLATFNTYSLCRNRYYSLSIHTYWWPIWACVFLLQLLSTCFYRIFTRLKSLCWKPHKSVKNLYELFFHFTEEISTGDTAYICGYQVLLNFWASFIFVSAQHLGFKLPVNTNTEHYCEMHIFI